MTRVSRCDTFRLHPQPGREDEVAIGLIMEFEGDVGAYRRVTENLGIDLESGEGEWPAGLLFHSGGAKPDGWIVSEVWKSREDQERFMAERLGQALTEAGVEGPPSRIQWFDLAAFHSLG